MTIPPPNLPQYDIRDLRNYLSRFQLAHGLMFLCSKSVALWGKAFEYHRGEAISEWQTGFLAQELIRVGSDLAPQRLNELSFVHATHLANSLRDFYQFTPATEKDEHELQMRSLMYRVAAEQFIFQVARGLYIPRYRSLFEILPNLTRSHNDPDLESEFLTIYGLPVADFLKIGFAVFTLVMSQKVRAFVPQHLLNSRLDTMHEVLTKEKIDAFLRATSLDVEEFRAELISLGSPPAGLEKHWISPLWMHPIIKTSLGYVVPSVWHLVHRITAGVYFDFLGRRLGNRKAIQEYTGFFGRVFEEHVGQELACHFGPAELLREPTYPRPGGDWRGPDWTIVEGQSATLLECKTSRLTKAERHRADLSVIVERLKQDIIPAIRLLPEKAEHIRHRVKGLGAWPEITEFELVVVTLEPWWPESLTKELIAQELGERSARYHLMWVEEVEWLGAFRPKTAIHDLLRHRWDGDEDVSTREFLVGEARRLGVKLEAV